MIGLLPEEWGLAPVDLREDPPDIDLRSSARVYRQDLPADVRAKMPWGRVQAREREEGDCPLVGVKDHASHWWIPDPKRPTSRHSCIGWHAFTASITRTSARFKPDYVRAKNSDLIHRSGHEGQVTWFPDRWHDPETTFHATFWDVSIGCINLWLRNPEVLSAAEVRAAEPRKPDGTIALCPKCFPR